MRKLRTDLKKPVMPLTYVGMLLQGLETVALETMTIKVILYLLLLKSSLGTSGSHMYFH